MFRLEKADDKWLDARGLSYRIAHIAGTTTVQAELVDLVSKQVVQVGLARDEKEAVENAIADARAEGYEHRQPGDAATVIKAQATEIANLKRRLNQLDAPVDSPETVEPSSVDEVVRAGDFESMTAEQLAEELELRDIEIPAGDRASDEWRIDALNLLAAGAGIDEAQAEPVAVQA